MSRSSTAAATAMQDMHKRDRKGTLRCRPPSCISLNEMADAIGEAYPGLWVSMFAYYGTSTPPAKTMPRTMSNVSYCFYNDMTSLPAAITRSTEKNCTEHPDDSYGTSNYNYAAEFDRWCRSQSASPFGTIPATGA